MAPPARIQPTAPRAAHGSQESARAAFARGSRPLVIAILGASLAACTSVRPGEESSSATNLEERIAELEYRVQRDRAVVEDFVSSTTPADEHALREVAWRLPENTRTLKELRGDDEEAPEEAEPASDGTGREGSTSEADVEISPSAVESE